MNAEVLRVEGLRVSNEREGKLAIMFITQESRVAGQICDSIIVMKNGRILNKACPARSSYIPRTITRRH